MNDLTEEMLRKATRLLRNDTPTKKQLLAGMMQAMVAEAKERLEFLQGVTALAKACAEEKRADDASPRVPIGDTEIMVSSSNEVTLWTFTGTDNFYPTKLAAEIGVRRRFPDEDPYRRYARLCFRNFVRD